jgi:hypothetical protein
MLASLFQLGGTSAEAILKFRVQVVCYHHILVRPTLCQSEVLHVQRSLAGYDAMPSQKPEEVAPQQ